MSSQKSSKKVSKLGAPSKYKPEYCQRVIEMGKKGESRVAMACDLDVSVDTLNEWTRVHPDFSAAYKKAQALSEVWWEKFGRAGGSGQIKGFNNAVWIFWMKARFRWREDPPPEEQEIDLDFT